MLLREKCQWHQHGTVTIVLALATLGGTTQIGLFLIANVSKEDVISGSYIAGFIIYHAKLCQCKHSFKG
jgi:hypothetical protein